MNELASSIWNISLVATGVYFLSTSILTGDPGQTTLGSLVLWSLKFFISLSMVCSPFLFSWVATIN